MNKIIAGFAVAAASASGLMADNPIIKHIFTADPSAHLYEGRVFIYPSHDQDKPDWFNMVDYHVFSSTNLVDWTDHGVALHVKDVPWAKEYMWAPDCAYKDGTYFFYFPARDKAGEFRIGVATSPSPAGPFKPEPNPIEGSFSIDPAVFIDDDGAAYMYFGGLGEHGKAKSPMVARLKDNMKEFAETPKRIEGADFFFEGAWMNKINGTGLVVLVHVACGIGQVVGAVDFVHPGALEEEIHPLDAPGRFGEFFHVVLQPRHHRRLGLPV
ncbi:MAG: family 43 glycosylhydrolase, partial [Spartobacteria bacterium]